MPDADDDDCKEHDRAVLAEDVEKDLEDGLPVVAADGGVEVLDGEQQAQDQEEAEERGHTHGREHTDRCTPRRSRCLLGKMCGRIEASDRVLGE